MSRWCRPAGSVSHKCGPSTSSTRYAMRSVVGDHATDPPAVAFAADGAISWGSVRSARATTSPRSSRYAIRMPSGAHEGASPPDTSGRGVAGGRLLSVGTCDETTYRIEFPNASLVPSGDHAAGRLAYAVPTR